MAIVVFRIVAEGLCRFLISEILFVTCLFSGHSQYDNFQQNLGRQNLKAT